MRVGAAIGGGLVALLGWAALLGPALAPYDPTAIDLSAALEGPSAAHLLGTGENGADLLSMILHGARLSLGVGLATVGISLVIGSILGAAAGWLGGWADELVMRVVDVLLAFPGILLAIFITAVLGASVQNVVFALCATGWVGYARLVRGQVRALRERDFVVAARALGAGDLRIVARHLLPNVAGPLVVQATFGVPAAILAESSLSFLGLGVPPGTPSWGATVDEGARFLLVAPHLSTAPGLCIALAVLGFNLLGDAIRDRLDPRSR